jgi:hypothetical protein
MLDTNDITGQPDAWKPCRVLCGLCFLQTHMPARMLLNTGIKINDKIQLVIIYTVICSLLCLQWRPA